MQVDSLIVGAEIRRPQCPNPRCSCPAATTPYLSLGSCGGGLLCVFTSCTELCYYMCNCSYINTLHGVCLRSNGQEVITELLPARTY